jgi:hypothetical protein
VAKRESVAALRCSMVVAALAIGAVPSRAAPILETDGRMEINWSQLRLRFYGEAQISVTSSDDEALRNAERKAWQDGISFVSGAVREIFPRFNRDLEPDPAQLEQDAQAAAKAAVTSMTSVSTTYFADGSVRVLLDTPLGRTLVSPKQRFRQKVAVAPGSMHFTGVVIRLDRPVAPRARYRIVDEQDQTVFEASDMAEDAFRKGLMGRWYRKPGPAEIQDSVGRNPAALDVHVVADDVWRVSRAAWEQVLDGHRALLVNGMIAIALP